MAIKNLKRVFKAVLAGIGLPMMVAAQETATTIDIVLSRVQKWLNWVLILAFIILTLYFAWGVVGYVRAGGDEKKVADAKRHIIYGIIGMAIAGAIWGIAYVIWNSLGITPGGTVPVPSF